MKAPLGENNFQRTLKGAGLDTNRPRSWRLLGEDVSLPAAVLYDSRIEHNLRWMQAFIERYGVKLAPHGKTTMCPALFRRQLDAGAWGITFATAPQLEAGYRHGVRRAILANQLVGKANMALVSALLEDPQFELYVLVDSPENVEQLGRFFRERGQRLNVLIELGVAGGRTGVRGDEDEAKVLHALAAWRDALHLRGAELYEGVLNDEAAIRAWLARAVDRLRAWVQSGTLAEGRAMLSGAGSAWFDVVAEAWRGVDIGRALDVVLRPGCYVTHDVGIYRDAAARIHASNPVARVMHSELLPALQVWVYVQSRPEARRAIVGFGKRDAAYDAGLPVPALYYRPGAASPSRAPAHWRVTKMMDQHAYLDVEAADDLASGDMLAFDISHPCLTFDKWQQVLLVDDDYRVLDVLPTFF